MSRRRRKKTSPLGWVILVLLLVLVAGLVVLRVMSDRPDALPEKADTETPSPGGESPVVDIYATAAPAPTTAEPEKNDDPAPTSTPTPTVSPSPTPTAPPAIILENDGELEIVIPDEMDSDGF